MADYLISGMRSSILAVQHDLEINVQHTCFKIVNKLKSELLSYIIFEFFMWHYRKWASAVIVVSNEIRIVDKLSTSK